MNLKERKNQIFYANAFSDARGQTKPKTEAVVKSASIDRDLIQPFLAFCCCCSL